VTGWVPRASYGTRYVPGQVLDILERLAERAEGRRPRRVCGDCGALHLGADCDVCYARAQAQIVEEAAERDRRLAAVRRMRRAGRVLAPAWGIASGAVGRRD